MEPDEYMSKLADTLTADGLPVCRDCGLTGPNVFHGIVNHKDGTVETVCDGCFKENYQAWLYGNK